MMLGSLTSLPARLAPVVGPGRFVLIRLAGLLRGQATAVTAVYLGTTSNLDFIRDYFFETAETEMLGSGYLPLVGVLPGARHRAAADLWLTDLPPLWRWLRPHAPGGVNVPAWVRQQVVLPPPGQGGAWPLPVRAAREVERHLRRNEWTLGFSSNPGEMGWFFDHYYQPYIRARHGAGAVVVERRRFLGEAAGQTLAWLCDGERRVAGMLLSRRGETLRLGWFGARTCPPPRGASEVLDALVLRHAWHNGVRRVDFGNSRPCLTDGVFRYKQRLGARAVRSPFPQATLTIDVPGGHPDVMACLRNHPLITRRGAGLGVARVAAGPDGTWRLQEVPHGDAA